MAENIDELGFAVIFGVILCREYSMLIHSQDNNQLNKLLKQYNDCSDSFEKTHISEQIKAITDEYPVLLGLYTVKMAAENAQKSNPADATRLLQIHDTVVSHFRNGNNDKAFELLDEALILRENYFSGFETGTGISQ
jgi:molecular chaperone DnaK